MWECKRCNINLSDGMLLCPECGFRPERPDPTPPVEEETKPKSKKK